MDVLYSVDSLMKVVQVDAWSLFEMIDNLVCHFLCKSVFLVWCDCQISVVITTPARSRSPGPVWDGYYGLSFFDLRRRKTFELKFVTFDSKRRQ
jgi:hypothetical protein